VRVRSDEVRPTVPSLEDLLRHTRRELIEYARGLGLDGLARLTKGALAARYLQALERIAGPADSPRPSDAPRSFPRHASETPSADPALAPVDAREALQIPWGYGQDRVTAMVVDPERLYVYWEVTDEALERARGELGRGGWTAWLNLRVYDVTNRIFDGTNAHEYFDHSVSRHDRQWFFTINRPSSTAVVEVGLKSEEGYFVRIARSSRADFPRREPVPAGDVEWLTVHPGSGEVGEWATERDGRRALVAQEGWGAIQPEAVRVWDIRRTHGAWDGEWIIRDESFGIGWVTANEWAQTIEWEGPIIRTTWEAGPFLYPVETPRYVEERHHDGPVTVHSVDGRSHVVHGSWQVVIRGIGARAERTILAVWEIRRSWVVGADVAMRASSGAASPPGSSEGRLLGASELYRQAASELRLGGASELYRFGASELRHLGASETLYVGASEWRARGASELRYLGASEWREIGASDRRLVGASERLHGGASERAWSGASEHRRRYPRERKAPASAEE